MSLRSEDRSPRSAAAEPSVRDSGSGEPTSPRGDAPARRAAPAAPPPQRPEEPRAAGHAALSTRAVAARLGARRRAESRFHWLCRGAVAAALGFLVLMLANILLKGVPGFFETVIVLPITFDAEVIDPQATRDPEVLAQANYSTLVRDALVDRFPEASGRRDRRALAALVSNAATFDLAERVVADPGLIGTTRTVELLASDETDLFTSGRLSRGGDEALRALSDQQLAWIDELGASGQLHRQLSKRFFTQGDSREPEMAGVWGAAVGSLYAMLVTLLLSFPLGVATAIYLEEFAPKNRWTDLIEININNLAAVPSIVFGLLGLAVFLNVFGLPRSAPLVGGLVLTLMTLPTIIIAGRVALKAVPPSIREAAYGLGASPMQTLVHHVLPLAFPGMLTGAIIGMARALGETAPLLMIGMVAFVVDVPATPLDPSTALPVQIYLWADSPERAFVAKTSAAILVLLAFLILMNGLAVVLRRRTETRWS